MLSLHKNLFSTSLIPTFLLSNISASRSWSFWSRPRRRQETLNPDFEILSSRFSKLVNTRQVSEKLRLNNHQFRKSNSVSHRFRDIQDSRKLVSWDFGDRDSKLSCGPLILAIYCRYLFIYLFIKRGASVSYIQALLMKHAIEGVVLGHSLAFVILNKCRVWVLPTNFDVYLF